MKRVALIAALLWSAGCKGSPQTRLVEDSKKHFAAEAPPSWKIDADTLERRPLGEFELLGEYEGTFAYQSFGAGIKVVRISRRPSDYPKPPAKGLQLALQMRDVLFSGKFDQLPKESRPPEGFRIEDATLAGFPAKAYSRESQIVLERDAWYSKTSIVSIPTTVHVQAIVVRTPEAYYDISYRATTRYFGKERAVFEQFLKTFKFGPKA